MTGHWGGLCTKGWALAGVTTCICSPKSGPTALLGRGSPAPTPPHSFQPGSSPFLHPALPPGGHLRAPETLTGQVLAGVCSRLTSYSQASEHETCRPACPELCPTLLAPIPGQHTAAGCWGGSWAVGPCWSNWCHMSGIAFLLAALSPQERDS